MQRFYAIFFLICASTAQLSNECNDPNWHTLEMLQNAKLDCGPFFKNRCYCMKTCYENHYQYVVNCTNSGFNTTAPLSHLPNKTQVKLLY